jgi:N-carbamoyl-L-amino-acid hydrolase
VTATFDRRWAALEPIGRHSGTGGYRRFAWTRADAELRDWFAHEAKTLSLDLTCDRAGNQWAWWGDPDADGPGLAIGSHLDSVPDGGAFDGPLGVVSALTVLEALQQSGARPAHPIGVVNFGDEEGARFGTACAGSRLLTGALSAERALSLRDRDGVAMDEAMRTAGIDADQLGRDDEALGRVGAFVELHVEQGRVLADLDRAVAVGSQIWPHGRWRVEFDGEANHAGTTRLQDRHDPMLALAEVVPAARAAAVRHSGLATCGKIEIEPNGVNAIPSRATVWLDARAADADRVRAIVGDVRAAAEALGGRVVEESWTGLTQLDTGLVRRLADMLPDAPTLATGAGHDAGVLAAAGIPTAMIFVRNPTGVSHSPAEFAERDDCLAGVAALAAVVAELVA